MNRNTEIQKKVDEAMESLNGIRKSEPQPFFYTRVQGRLMGKHQSGWEGVVQTITRPAVAFVSIALVLLLNIFIVFSEPATPVSNEGNDLAVADEYVRASSFYDLENVMP